MNKFKLLTSSLVFLFAYVLISFCWVGAEYFIDGWIVSSKVDSIVAYILAVIVTRKIIKLDELVAERKKADGD